MFINSFVDNFTKLVFVVLWFYSFVDSDNWRPWSKKKYILAGWVRNRGCEACKCGELAGWLHSTQGHCSVCLQHGFQIWITEDSRAETAPPSRPSWSAPTLSFGDDSCSLGPQGRFLEASEKQCACWGGAAGVPGQRQEKAFVCDICHMWWSVWDDLCLEDPSHGIYPNSRQLVPVL